MRNKNHSHGSRHKKWIFWLFGLGSFSWLLLRSGTNPRRLTYPCQRAALASSLGFLGYPVSFLGGVQLYRRLKRRAALTGAALFTLMLLLTITLTGSHVPVPPTYASLATLPGWTSPTAVSNVFVVPNVPVPDCSLDGGTLPSTPPCSDASYALRDGGVDQLVNEMESRGDYFFKTPSHPNGIVGANDVVVIKINDQWGGQGDGNGYGRLSTNTDVLKGLIWRILQHPDGFTGEIVIAENTQDVNSGWDTTPANAQDQDQSYQDVVDAFEALGHPVSLFNWDDLNDDLISGGDVGASGYPTGEYIHGNTDDAYILLGDPAGTGSDELSYPKFQTDGGSYVSMRYGVWNGSSYDADRLTFINVPVLKKHGMAGSTIAWKNLIGFVTIYDTERRYGSWDIMHDFFWGYNDEASRDYGLIGREMALIRAPDLNVVDAIWVAVDGNTGGNAIRENVLLASTDPFAVDWYASEYVLRPIASGDPQGSSAARGGTFRSATRTNQNAAASTWLDGSYPYIDLLDGYDGSTPSDDERNQMNAYVVGGAPSPTPTSTPTATGPPSTATPTATATATPTPTGTPPTGQQTVTFQDGVWPDDSYAGTTDSTITTWSGNSYANLGGLDYLQVGETGDADEFRLLVRFEVDAWLPAGIQVDEAWLELRAYDSEYDGSPHDVVAHRVIEEWVEGNGWDLGADGRSEGVTWTTARPGVNWVTPGGDFGPAELDRVTVAANPDGWYRWDVTSAVRAWVAGTTQNYGLLLEPDNAPYLHHQFRSSEYSTPNLRPRLVVTYSDGGAATPTPTASAIPINPDLPDLIVNSMVIELETGGACDYTSTQLGVRVWIENIDSGDAQPFVVDVNGSQQDISSGLAADQVTSAWLAGAHVWPGENTAFADATFLIEESNEDNNQLTQLLPIPTLPPTCTPISTPTPTRTPVSTPTPTRTGTPPAYRFVYLPLILKNWAPPIPTPTPTPTTVIPAGLIQPSDLVYQGAFRLPDDAERPRTFEYGGSAMTFNPNGDAAGPADGFPGSLFIMGHDRLAWGELPDGNQVAELSIPVPVVSNDPNQLDQAGFIQGFYDVTTGYFTALEEIPRVGMEYLDAAATGPKIHLAWGQHMPPESPIATHAWFDPNLAAPNFQGAWFIGDQSTNSVNGYMFTIPTAWADAHAAGRYLATGRFRDGGWSGMGPALFAYRPWQPDGSPPPSGTRLEETVLLLYESSENTENIERCLNGYQHPDEWEGGAWIATNSSKTAVLFAGTKSTGAKYWYGWVNPAGPQYPCVEVELINDFLLCRMSDGTSCPPEDFAGCEGHNDYRGWWSTRFDAQFILYDPADLARVAAGETQSWEPQPYAALDIDDHLYLNPAGVEQDMLGTGVQRRGRIGAVAYDRNNNLLYVLELYADEAKPVVHVWRISG